MSQDDLPMEQRIQFIKNLKDVSKHFGLSMSSFLYDHKRLTTSNTVSDTECRFQYEEKEWIGLCVDQNLGCYVGYIILRIGFS